MSQLEVTTVFEDAELLTQRISADSEKIEISTTATEFVDTTFSMYINISARMYLTFFVEGITLIITYPNPSGPMNFVSTQWNLNEENKTLIGDIPAGTFRVRVIKAVSSTSPHVQGKIFALSSEIGNGASLNDWLHSWEDGTFWKPSNPSIRYDLDDNKQPTFYLDNYTLQGEFLNLCSTRVKTAGSAAPTDLIPTFLTVFTETDLPASLNPITSYYTSGVFIHTYQQENDPLTIGWAIPQSARGATGNWQIKIMLSPVGIRTTVLPVFVTFDRFYLEKTALDQEPIVPRSEPLNISNRRTIVNGQWPKSNNLTRVGPGLTKITKLKN